jgi:hypothetical protein
MPNILSVRQQKYFLLYIFAVLFFYVAIPTDNVVVQWLDYLYESIHKEEIRNQLDLTTVAEDLGIEPEILDLCLELSGFDRISTARQLFKQCVNYDVDIQKEHCWQDIDEDIVIKICSKCLIMTDYYLLEIFQLRRLFLSKNFLFSLFI